uniref:Uncharacterized protein n=1 Tax=Pyxicephalus adspersus TaxID=30357 RepID=A0AAV3A873_PYXAD|nr:TPA: hypothetical protein GDO54_017875 [Pyxicephalus adspersus]
MAAEAQELTQAEIHKLQKKREAVEKELQELCVERKILKKDLEKKQELVQVLKLRRDSYLEKEQRQREQSEEYKKRTTNLSTQILEEKLKQRKQRMEFQDQLEDLMTKHKNLAEFYNPKRLEEEILHMEEQKKELKQEEKEKLLKLKELEETEIRLREQGILTPEKFFLHSEEAACTVLKAELQAAEEKLMKFLGAMYSEMRSRPILQSTIFS